MDERYTDNQELAILKGAVENTHEAFVTIDEHHRVHFYNQGLPICKRIIESHPGSSIEVISEEGKGTEVRVTLPRRSSEESR